MSHAVIDGQSDIPPAEERLLEFGLQQKYYEEVVSTFAIKTCSVRLRVRYVNVQ